MSDGYDAGYEAPEHNDGYQPEGYEAPEVPVALGAEIGAPMDSLLNVHVDYHEGGEDYKEGDYKEGADYKDGDHKDDDRKDDDYKDGAPAYGADYVDPKDTKVEDYNPAAH